jgi:hypothetical protein
MAKTVLYAILGFAALIIIYRILESAGLLGPKKPDTGSGFLSNEVVTPILQPIGEAEAGLIDMVKNFFSPSQKGNSSTQAPLTEAGTKVADYSPITTVVGTQQPSDYIPPVADWLMGSSF